MRAFDLTPFRRQMIGFDRLFDMIEKTAPAQGPEGYPPFDIERVADDQFRIAIAVAGFRPEEVDVQVHNSTLTVTGRKAEENGQRQWLHRGIAARAFERRFELADFIQVKGADLKDGLLTIDLAREVPEAAKPRKVAIGGQTGPASVQIEATANQNTGGQAAA
jgi:molecular chaperone IbpA